MSSSQGISPPPPHLPPTSPALQMDSLSTELPGKPPSPILLSILRQLSPCLDGTVETQSGGIRWSHSEATPSLPPHSPGVQEKQTRFLLLPVWIPFQPIRSGFWCAKCRQCLLNTSLLNLQDDFLAVKSYTWMSEAENYLIFSFYSLFSSPLFFLPWNIHALSQLRGRTCTWKDKGGKHIILSISALELICANSRKWIYFWMETGVSSTQYSHRLENPYQSLEPVCVCVCVCVCVFYFIYPTNMLK